MRLTLADYEAMGGFGKALSERLDAIYKKELTEREARIAEILFRNLSKRDTEQRDIRQPVRVDRVAALAGVESEEVITVVEHFRGRGRNFIMPYLGDLGPETLLDVSHESLLRQWERLRGWLADEARSAEMYRRIERAAIRYKNEEGDLLARLDLAYARAWWEEKRPTALWASRYGLHFDLAESFLSASEEKKVQDEERKRQEYLERTLELFESRLTHASLLAKIEDYAAARETLNETRELDKEMPADRLYARNLMAWYADLMGGQAEKVYEGAGAVLQNVAVSPDRSLLAAVGERGAVVLFDEKSGEVRARLVGHKTVGSAQETSVKAAVFHPEGKWLATAGNDSRIILWSLPDGEKLKEWEAPAKVKALALGPNGDMLASGRTDNDITLWNGETGERLRTLEGHQNNISGLAFSPDGRLLVSSSYDRTARVWDVETGETQNVLQGHTNAVQGVAFHPDKPILASSSDDKYIVLWNLETGDRINVLRGHENYVVSLQFIDKGRRLISSSMDRTLRIWDTDTGVTLRVLQGHQAGGTGLAVKDDAVYSAANDVTVRRWGMNIEDLKVIDLQKELASSAISPDGTAVAAGCANGDLILYSMEHGDTLWEQKDTNVDRIMRLAFSPDGSHIISGGFDDKTLKLWDAKEGTLIQTFEGHTDDIHAVAFSPDGKAIASASYDGRIGLFEIGKEEGKFHAAHEGIVGSVAFSGDGASLLSAGVDGATRIWDIRTWLPTLIREYPKSNERIIWAAISPDGKRIAAVGRDLLVHVYDTESGGEEHAFVGHEQAVFRAEFSPDGGQVATVSGDATVRFWDLKTGTALFKIELPSPKGPPVPLWDFSFRCTPSGDCLIAVPLTSGKLVLYRMQGIYKD